MAVLKRAAPFAVYAVVFAALVSRSDVAVFAAVNLAVQIAVFAVGACVPAHRTGFMSYVDVAWPWGLAALGVQVLFFGDLTSPATVAVGAVYLLMGTRMGAWALRFMVIDRLPAELPRYRYQRRRWERDGFRSERLSLQVEIMVQCGANASVLAIPALLATTPSASLGAVGLAGVALWAAAFVWESVADRQKARFAARCRREGVRRTCDTGLWRHSRHPNYFGQWMQWNGLILVSLPAVAGQWPEASPLSGVLTLGGLVWVSWTMYHTLVHWTGAVPAEYFSSRRRPDYAAYQRTTNRFFPGPRRPLDDAEAGPATGAVRGP